MVFVKSEGMFKMQLADFLLIGIILSSLGLILSNRFSPDVVALLVLLMLGFSAILTPQQTLSGFSSPVVITLIGLFILTQALEDVGIIQRVAKWINNIGGGSESYLVFLFMSAGAMLSLVMNNVAAGAVLLPAAVRVGHSSNVRLSKLLIPLSFGTLLGGMATYLTTANIILSGLLHEQGLATIGMLDFIPTGGLIVIMGVIYMMLIGRHLLPERESLSQNMREPDLQQAYQLAERLWRVQVLPDSRLVNTSLADSQIGIELGLMVVALIRGKQTHMPPPTDMPLHAQDHLLVVGRRERVERLLEWGVQLVEDTTHLPPYELDFIETIIPPRSSTIGQTLTQLRHRTTSGLSAVALWREGRSYRTDVGKMPLQVGDALLMIGSAEHVQKFAQDRNFLVPANGYTHRPLRPHKARWALAISFWTLLITIFDWFPLPYVILSGALALVLTDCIRMEEAYQAIEWRVVFLVAGMLPLSLALTESGLADQLGLWFVSWLSNYSPLVFVGGMFLFSMCVTQIIGGQVAGLIVGPIAIHTALQLNISPQAMAVAVAIGCSTAFLTPIAHPVNILMMGPGGYRFADFFKVGVGMTLITCLTLLVGMRAFWGIR